MATIRSCTPNTHRKWHSTKEHLHQRSSLTLVCMCACVFLLSILSVAFSRQADLLNSFMDLLVYLVAHEKYTMKIDSLRKISISVWLFFSLFCWISLEVDFPLCFYMQNVIGFLLDKTQFSEQCVRQFCYSFNISTFYVAYMLLYIMKNSSLSHLFGLFGGREFSIILLKTEF